jgi:hypothetical protein
MYCPSRPLAAIESSKSNPAAVLTTKNDTRNTRRRLHKNNDDYGEETSLNKLMGSATAADVGRIGYQDVAALPRCQLQDDKNDE